MAQDSIAYGESLLADIRTRNDKLRSQAKSDRKKDVWKAAAVKIGLGVANNIYEQRQNQLLNNEENLANKFRTTNALDVSSRYSSHEKKSNEFSGGVDSYWQTQASPEVENYLQSTYAAGTYNKNEYNLFKNQLSKQWGQQLYKEHQEGLKLTQDFLKTGGGDKDAYNNAVKRNRGDKGIIGGVANWIGKGTGLLAADVNNSTEKLLTSSDALTQYKSAYAGSGDSALSVFVAEQGLLKDVDLGAKAPTFGTPMMRKDEFGGETAVIPMTTYDSEGRVKSLVMMSPDANGNFSFDTQEAATRKKSFSLLSSQIATTSNKAYLNAGQQALQNIGGDKSTALTAAFEKIVKEADHRSTSKIGQTMLQTLSDTASAKAGAIIYRAEREEWASISEASAIAGEMVVSAYTSGNVNRGLADAGLGNPYHTMFAIESAIAGKKMNNTDGLSTLSNKKNIINMFEAYRTETVPARAAIDAKLEANKYFENKASPRFKQYHATIKSLVGKGIEGTGENLGIEFNLLFPVKANVPTGTETTENLEVPTAITVGAMSTLASPATQAQLEADKGRKLSRPEQLKLIGQQSRYTVVQKANDELLRVQNLPDAVRQNMPPKSYSIQLKRAQDRLDTKTAQYKSKYGLSLNSSELADLSAKEKEDYFATGKIPDRHTPAV